MFSFLLEGYLHTRFSLLTRYWFLWIIRAKTENSINSLSRDIDIWHKAARFLSCCEYRSIYSRHQRIMRRILISGDNGSRATLRQTPLSFESCKKCDFKWFRVVTLSRSVYRWHCALQDDKIVGRSVSLISPNRSIVRGWRVGHCY